MSEAGSRVRALLAGVAGAAGAVAVLTIFSRLLGFGRWLAQATYVGDNATGDAYAAANVLPNVLYEVVAGGALAGVVVPLLVGPIAHGRREDVDALASALLTWAMAVLTPLALLVAVFARPIVGLLGTPAGVDPQVAEDLTTTFLQIFAPQMVLYGVGIVLTGVLQAHRRFVAAALAPIASTLVVIVSYVVFGALANGTQTTPERLPDAAVAVLAWGTTAGVVALSLPLLVPTLLAGVRFRPRLRFPEGAGARARRLAAAGLIGVLAQQVAVLVVLQLARTGGVSGTYNVFQYTQAVYLLPYAVLAVPLVTVFAPRLATLAADDRSGTLSRMAQRSTRTVLAVSVAGAATLMSVAPAAQALFGVSEGMTVGLSVMAPGIVGLALLLHAGRMLLALDRGRVAALWTAAAWLTTALAAAVGVAMLSPDGGDGPATLLALGLAHTIGMTVGGTAVLLALSASLPTPLGAPVLRTIAVSIASGAVTAFVGRLVVDALLELGSGTVAMAVLAALAGAVVVGLGTLLALGTFDRAILADVRQTHG